MPGGFRLLWIVIFLSFTAAVVWASDSVASQYRSRHGTA